MPILWTTLRPILFGLTVLLVKMICELWLADYTDHCVPWQHTLIPGANATNIYEDGYHWVVYFSGKILLTVPWNS
jgi:hypothetical protein